MMTEVVYLLLSSMLHVTPSKERVMKVGGAAEMWRDVYVQSVHPNSEVSRRPELVLAEQKLLRMSPGALFLYRLNRHACR